MVCSAEAVASTSVAATVNEGSKNQEDFRQEFDRLSSQIKENEEMYNKLLSDKEQQLDSILLQRVSLEQQ